MNRKELLTGLSYHQSCVPPEQTIEFGLKSEPSRAWHRQDFDLVGSDPCPQRGTTVYGHGDGPGALARDATAPSHAVSPPKALVQGIPEIPQSAGGDHGSTNRGLPLAIVNFWKGRCLRTRGEYGEALIYTCRGKDLALELGHPRMAAVIQVLESWLLFQQGKSKEATRISQEAETALRETEDYVTLGNVQSFYGRPARREGRYDKAIELFTHAITQFRKRDAEHPNLARSLANMALAKRGIALQLQRKIDQNAERRRKPTASHESKHSSRNDYRERLLQLRQQALEHLDAARAIYQRHPNFHGVGTLSLNAAYIHLDNSDFQTAEMEAASAFHLAEEKQDYILMGRVGVLQCMIENAKVEEEISEGADPGRHARRALEFIQGAVDLAKQTQHELLLARAYLWRGLTHCNSFFDDPETARQSYDFARASWRCGAHRTRGLDWRHRCIARRPVCPEWLDRSNFRRLVCGRNGVAPLPTWS